MEKMITLLAEIA